MVEKTFTLPSGIHEKAAQLIVDWSNPQMFSLAEQLERIGVPAALALQIEIGANMSCAARVGVLGVAMTEGRVPTRERWLEATAEDFDKALAWFVEKFPEKAAELGMTAPPTMLDMRFVL